MKNERESGVSLVETLLSAAILVLIVTGLVGALIYGRESTFTSGLRSRAVLLAGEGMEATRDIRDGAFANLTLGNHGLTATASWSFAGTSDAKELFTRQISVATGAGSTDRRDVTVSATWQQTTSRTGLIKMFSRFTNWARKFGDWSLPTQEASINLAGAQNGMALAQSGQYVYLVRDGGTPSFVVIDVNNPASPAVVASLTLTGNLRNIAISGNYAYITSNADTAELQIVDITTPTSPVAVGSFNVTGNSDGSGIAVVGTTVYMTTANTSTNNFVIIDASTPSAPTQFSIMSRPGALNELSVMGGNAYIASDSDTGELQIINVSNPSAPTLVTAFNMTGTSNALTVTVYRSPDTLFVGRQDGTIYVVDVSTPASPSETSSFAAGTLTNDVYLGLSSGYLVLASSNTSAEFRVMDVSTLATPTSLGTLNLASPLNGVVYDPVRDRVYAASQSDTAEFIVIKPS